MNRKIKEMMRRRQLRAWKRTRRKRRKRLRLKQPSRRLKPLAFCPFCNPEDNQYPLFPRRKNA